MAEAAFSRIARERGVEQSLRISSAATSDCEEGNSVYPPAEKVLKEKGYNFSHRSKVLTVADVKNADYVLVMDEMNLSDVLALTGGKYKEKVIKLGGFLPKPIDVDDPWVTREFERAYREIYDSCSAFMNFLLATHAEAFAYDKRH